MSIKCTGSRLAGAPQHYHFAIGGCKTCDRGLKCFSVQCIHYMLWQDSGDAVAKVRTDLEEVIEYHKHEHEKKAEEVRRINEGSPPFLCVHLR